MLRTRARFVHLVVMLVAGFLTAGLAVEPTAAQSGEVRAVMRIESGGQPAMEMEYYLGDGRMRMDLPQGMSTVWVSGDSPTMLMIQHPQQQYMEWGPDQLKMMQQMMQRMPGGGGNDQDSDFDPTRIRFRETGRREQIGEWNAFEVEVTGLDDQEGAFWMTTDVDVGLFEISTRVADAASMLSMPMAGGPGGGSQALARYQALASAQGLPEGRVVRMNFEAEDQPTTMTLVSIEPGPLPAGAFDPPTGYERMQMPSIPGLPD